MRSQSVHRYVLTRRLPLRAALVAVLAGIAFGLAPLSGGSPTSAQEAAAPPAGTLVKFVILSRHGVRSPIPEPKELATWTDWPWPAWQCANDPERKPGCLTPAGAALAQQMGSYYRNYLSALIPVDRCPTPTELYILADGATERTKTTGLRLLAGFLAASCNPQSYFHTTDRIFHPVGSSDGCTLKADRAEAEMIAYAGGDLANVAQALRSELAAAQHTLQCCTPALCVTAWNKTCLRQPPAPNSCSLIDRLASCPVRHPETGVATNVQTGGALRVASTFAEILLLEYANGFPADEVGWGRYTPEQLTAMFRLHTTAFTLEQRMPYIAALQGSMLLRQIVLALKDEPGEDPAAPRGSKFVALVGHDTNIANLAGMLGLTWLQAGYQSGQTPPAGALTFELRRSDAGMLNVYVAYVAQSLDDMRYQMGTHPIRTPVAVPGCSTTEAGFPCPLAQFAALVEHKLDKDCSQ